MGKKNVLIVFAHQEPKSFNGALKDVAVETLKGQGHDVTVSDLYAMKFDPTASKEQFTDLHNPDHFDFQQELRSAAERNCLPDDIKAEVDKILAADLVILQFPMYWLGMPAILKGWIDRCFAENVCFDTVANKWFDNGMLKDKKLLLSMTTGGSAGFFSSTGVFGDMNVILWPIQNSLRFTGFNVLKPQISYAPKEVTEDERAEMLRVWKNRLLDVWGEDPQKFIDIKHFDENDSFQLKKSFLEENGTCGAITPGQNLGRLDKI